MDLHHTTELKFMDGTTDASGSFIQKSLIVAPINLVFVNSPIEDGGERKNKTDYTMYIGVVPIFTKA